MMRSFFIMPLVLGLMLAALAGCQRDDVASAAYKALRTSDATYQATLEAVRDAREQGLISPAAVEDVRRIALVYHGSWELAAHALAAYQTALETGEPAEPLRRELGQALAAMAGRLTELQTAAGRILEGTK